ncbi:MAG: ATP-binding protein [Burkholderiales bacterium]
MNDAIERSRIGWGVRLAAGAVAALSMLVIAGWFVASPMLVQLHSQWAPMQLNAAACFLLTGLGLLLLDRAARASLAAGAVVLVVGAITIFEYLAGTETGIDRLLIEPFTTVQTSHPGRMAPNTAAAFCMAGGALLVLGSHRLAARFLPAAWSLGLVTAFIGAISALAYVAGAPAATGWRAFTSMALSTALAFVVTGGAIAAASAVRYGEAERLPWRWLPGLVTTVLLLVAFNLWQALVAQSVERLEIATEQVLDRTRAIVLDRVQAQLNLIERLTMQWSHEEGFPEESRWRSDAAILLDHFPYIAGIGLTDTDWIYRRTAFRNLTLDAVGKRADVDPLRRRAIQEAIAQRTIRITPALEILPGGLGFAIAAPMFRDGTFRGLTMAGIRFDDLLLFAEGPQPRGFVTALLEGDRELIRSPANAPLQKLSRRAPIELPGATWTLQVWPTPQQVSVSRGTLPELVLGFGILVAILMGIALAAIQLVARKNRELSGFTRVLETEIAERKSAEEAERTLNLELEDRVQERTRDLEAMNKELEAFSYSVSHDLRQPLSSIAGFSKMLMDDYGEKLDAAALHYLQRIHGNVTRMGQLIDDLLDLARVNRAELDIQPVDLTALARQITGRLREPEPQRQVNVHITDGMRAHADRILIGVALENLLSNAWKFSRDRKPAEIEFGCEQRDGRTVFHVRDNGAGYDPQFSHKLFGVFQRLHAESEFPGNGVGLATVNRVIARHHGEVWSESSPGNGAVFFFWLPG